MSRKPIKPVRPYWNVPPVGDRLNPASLVSTERSQLTGSNRLRRRAMTGQICSTGAAHHRVDPLA